MRRSGCRRVGCQFPGRPPSSPRSFQAPCRLCPVILEGLVTTTATDGSLHLAAMGPEIADTRAFDQIVLKPFGDSQTARLLAAQPTGVFHLTDDVLLLARVVTDSLPAPPAARAATAVPGWVLEEACEAFEFRIVHADVSGPRARLSANVVARHHGRPFRGFNRAAHAVVEAAILSTRVHLLGQEEVTRQLDLLRPLIDKTAGDREREAFALLAGTCDRTGSGPAETASDKP